MTAGTRPRSSSADVHGRPHQGQDPPSTTSTNPPSPQASAHVESLEHDSEQLAVQRIRQVAPSVQVTLLLGPTVMSQVEPFPQSTLHESPHDPLQSL
jgi:hypothetical protein